MGDIVPLGRHDEQGAKPDFINTGILDKERFARLERITQDHISKLDDKMRMYLVGHCMRMQAGLTDEQLIEMVNNPVHEKEWAEKGVKWAAVVAILRLRKLAP